MHVVVLGAGVVGVTTAWYLAQAGHSVTVVDRRGQAGQETSFANAGHVAASYPEPLANPRTRRQLLHGPDRGNAPLSWVPRADVRQWQWLWRFLRQCSTSRSERNLHAIGALAQYSRLELARLRKQLGLNYDSCNGGSLRLFFDARAFANAQLRVGRLQEAGVDLEVCGPDRCAEIEPALAEQAPRIAGALHFSADESGDAHRFTAALADCCVAAGVEFRYDTAIDALCPEGRDVAAVRVCSSGGEPENLPADAFVVALGSRSPMLLRRLGIRTWIMPVTGYSVTLPLADGTGAPVLPIDDTASGLTVSRLGTRLRVTGRAEVGGHDAAEVCRVRGEVMLGRLRTLFPRLQEAGEPVYWSGSRALTPGGVPLLGRTAYPRLFLNIGHGGLGWTLACGSARAVADMVSAHAPEPDFPFLGRNGAG